MSGNFSSSGFWLWNYAINELLFHCKTQNSARPDKGKGLAYIKYKETNKLFLLFVREKPKNEYGNSMGYVFIGEEKLKDFKCFFNK